MAHAQFGFGGVVFDPRNFAQNLLTAARTLQQINNQVRSLRNEADALVNDAKDLANLDFNSQAELIRLLNEIADLLNDANAITYQVEETERVFQETFPQEYESFSNTEIAESASLQWETSHAGYQDAVMMHSQIVSTVQADTEMLGHLMTESARAGGNLSIEQAGNQIAALNAKQNMQIQELMAAQFRAEALERARRLEIERQGPVLLDRFVGEPSAYSGN
jgi:P-type conjugative transfer protein TrbJ